MNRIIFFILASILFIGCNSGEINEKAWLDLFNGQDLDGWYTWQRAPEPSSDVPGIPQDENGRYLEPIGRDRDPLHVFTIVEEDGEPAIRISGETFGILVTNKAFSNYHLILQYKWGDEKYPPRENELMDSGVLYHSVGPEGAWGGVWMKSFECQVMEGATGDFICVDTVMADIPASRESPDQRYHFDTEGGIKTFDVENGYCVKSKDYAKPAGEWNTLEIYTFEGESIHIVNGHLIMHTTNLRQIRNGEVVPLTEGKIQLQSEGAEIFYRDIRIKEIDSIPENI